MIDQSHTCYKHARERRIREFDSGETVRLCSNCVIDLRQIFYGDQQAAEEQRFVVFVQGAGRELARYTSTEGLSEALGILEDLKRFYPLVFVLRGYRAFALARDGEVKAV